MILQKFSQKKLLFWFFICVGYETLAENQLLNRADSLLERKRFSEAFILYEKVADSSTRFSSDIFLKMAFIQENLGNYDRTLYFLNCYYLQNPAESTLRKMELLANQYNLKGYSFTDLDFLWVLYDRYFLYLLAGITGLSFFVFISLLLRRRRKNFTPIRRNIVFLVLLALFIWFLNLHHQQRYFIIHNDNTFLKTAPAAGSAVIQIIPKGYRFPINSQTDVWIETEWNHQKVFVHQKNGWKVEKE